MISYPLKYFRMLEIFVDDHFIAQLRVMMTEQALQLALNESG